MYQKHKQNTTNKKKVHLFLCLQIYTAREIKILDIYHHTLTSNYPKEDVFGGVKPGCIDAGSEGREALTDDSAGEAGDGALCDGSLLSLLASCYCVSHHKVYGTFCGTPNLKNTIMNQYHIILLCSFSILSIHWHEHGRWQWILFNSLQTIEL